MKISVVTISFNQAEFLERTILSVLEQRGPGIEVEYIVVDPGSTDGSRDIIAKYRDSFAAVILEPDAGPADGLNRGFARATGDLFFYLNSDDTVLPGAFAAALREFERDPDLDVLCGHSWAIDEDDVRLRRIWSDPFSRLAVAYGASIQMQPSTYFRAETFRKVGGFNAANRLSWDGELLANMYAAGAKMRTVNQFLSNYRLHAESITGGAVSEERFWRDYEARFRRIMGRDIKPYDRLVRALWWGYRQFRNPAAFFERLLHGPVYRRSVRAR